MNLVSTGCNGFTRTSSNKVKAPSVEDTGTVDNQMLALILDHTCDCLIKRVVKLTSPVQSILLSVKLRNIINKNSPKVTDIKILTEVFIL